MEILNEKYIAGDKVSNRLFPKYNQVINMAWGIWLLSFVRQMDGKIDWEISRVN